jgi:transposase
MVMIGKVLRMHHREKKSVREIAKATSLARNTVRKYLRLGKAEQPQYRRPAVPTKLAPYVEQLEQAPACRCASAQEGTAQRQGAAGAVEGRWVRRRLQPADGLHPRLEGWPRAAWRWAMPTCR